MSISYIFSILSFGAFSIITQSIFLREFLVIFYGNELSLGIIFVSWFLGITLGAWTSNLIIPKIKDYLKIYIFLLIILSIEPLFQIFIIRALRLILKIPLGEYIPLLKLFLSSLAIIIPFSFLIGVIFPIACKIYEAEKIDSVSIIGKVYITESLGSVIGGILFTFIFIIYFNLINITLISEIFTLLSACFLSLTLFNKKRIFKFFFFLSSIILVSYILLVILGYSEKVDYFTLKKRWTSIAGDIKLVKSVDSKYQNIAIGISSDQYMVYTNGQYASSFPDPYRFAIEAHFLMTLHPNPEKILLIGMGVEGLISEMIKYNIKKLDYVELDPLYIDSIKEFLSEEENNILNDPRINIFYEDGRYFIKNKNNLKELYDMIMILLPDPSNAMINRFYTVEFYKESIRILKEDGLFITKVASSADYFGQDLESYTGSIYNTLKAVFPYILVSPGTQSYFFASKHENIATFDYDTLYKRFKNRNITSSYFSPNLFQTLLEKERVDFVKKSLENMSDITVNTDLKPISYFYNMILWERYSSYEGGKLLKKFKYTNINWIILLISVLVLPFFFYNLIISKYYKINVNRINRLKSLYSIFAVGFSGMALEIILLFSFQAIYGYIYQKIGFITGVFMVGLAIGGYISPKVKLNSRIFLILISLCIILFSIFIPSFIKILVAKNFGEYLFMLSVILIGILTGGSFPLSNKIFIENGGTLGESVSKTDSLDHLGACLGAFFTGVIFIPILGIIDSCMLVAFINLISIILWIIRP